MLYFFVSAFLCLVHAESCPGAYVDETYPIYVDDAMVKGKCPESVTVSDINSSSELPKQDHHFLGKTIYHIATTDQHGPCHSCHSFSVTSPSQLRSVMYKDGKKVEDTGDFYCLKDVCFVNVGGKIEIKKRMQ